MAEEESNSWPEGHAPWDPYPYPGELLPELLVPALLPYCLTDAATILLINHRVPELGEDPEVIAAELEHCHIFPQW